MGCFTLWTANTWLMRNSFEFHGVFSSLDKAIVYAKVNQLLTKDGHVVIDFSTIDHHKATCRRVFSTESDADRKQLTE